MYQNILVPLDGSELGEAALATAVDIARCTGATLTLIRVPDHPMMEYYIDQPVVLADLRSRDAERARDYLDAIAGRLRQDAPPGHAGLHRQIRARIDVRKHRS